jgi:hypothetical protein
MPLLRPPSTACETSPQRREEAGGRSGRACRRRAVAVQQRRRLSITALISGGGRVWRCRCVQLGMPVDASSFCNQVRHARLFRRAWCNDPPELIGGARPGGSRSASRPTGRTTSNYTSSYRPLQKMPTASRATSPVRPSTHPAEACGWRCAAMVAGGRHGACLTPCIVLLHTLSPGAAAAVVKLAGCR